MWRPGGPLVPQLLAVVQLLSVCPSQAVIGGALTSIQLHPYQVAVDFQGQMICGGALLSPRTVITAASCFMTLEILPYTLTVRVGSQLRESGGEAFQVADYEEHPDYNVYWGNSDALVLYLKDPVPFRAEVQPVALPAPSDAVNPGDKLILTGYGDLYEGEVLPAGEQRQLQAANLTVFNQDMCNELYYFTTAKGNNRACAGESGAACVAL